MPFKRHTGHDRVLLEELCRTIDNTSVLALKMLVVMYRGPCIDVHERANEGELVAKEEYVSSRRSRHAFVRVQSYGERKELG